MVGSRQTIATAASSRHSVCSEHARNSIWIMWIRLKERNESEFKCKCTQTRDQSRAKSIYNW